MAKQKTGKWTPELRNQAKDLHRALDAVLELSRQGFAQTEALPITERIYDRGLELGLQFHKVGLDPATYKIRTHIP